MRLIRLAILMASRTSSSVSGRGMSTSGVTWNTRPQNSARPVTYWMGSPFCSRDKPSSRAFSPFVSILYCGSTICV